MKSEKNDWKGKADGERPKRTIMIVDDDPVLLRTMEKMLSKRYRVTFASSGSQALVNLGRVRPDLILMDYDMPVCNGMMTLEMLRSEEETRNIPVVFLTGMSESDVVQEVVSLRPQGYILKPPAESRIVETIERVLSESDRGRAGAAEEGA